jgi:hypothetical protein
MQGFGDNFILVILSEDDVLHTDEHPFCCNDTCPCREDHEALTAVNTAVMNGLLTADEATAFIQGRTV